MSTRKILSHPSSRLPRLTPRYSYYDGPMATRRGEPNWIQIGISRTAEFLRQHVRRK